MNFDIPKHFLRFGIIRERTYFSEMPDSFDAVVFNANMVAYTPTSIANFVAGGSADIKSFIIDPLTHAFQHDPTFIMSENKDGELSVKLSIKKMADYYREPILDKLGQYPIKPNDFKDDYIIEQFCENVIMFQKRIIHEQADEMDLLDYYEYLGIKDRTIPCLYIAPYFYMNTSTYDRWKEKNILFINKSKDIFENELIFSEIAISKDLLNAKTEDLISCYSSSTADGFLIWINDLDETEVDRNTLSKFIEFLKGLKETKKPIINLYGGFFSFCLINKDINSLLNGVCHGLEYGENRPIKPVGGGIPISKFYLPQLHKRIKFRTATRFLNRKGYLKNSDSYYQNVCDCPTCKKIIGDNIDNFIKYGKTKPSSYKRDNQIITIEYPTMETKDYCIRHYLNKKREEFEYSKEKGIDDILTIINNSITDYEPIMTLEDIDYLNNWYNILSNLKY